MKDVNLFEQQATALRNVRLMSNDAVLRGVLGLIDGASLDTCRDIAAYLSVRLFAMEKQHSGMKAANLDEAAHYIADAVRDIQCAINTTDETPCACGKCDDCIAARSDEHYDRKRDGE